MTLHRLKCWRSNFLDIVDGKKPFEVRVNDRDYRVGDILELWEWFPQLCATSGRVARVRVSSMVQGRFGLSANVCVMGFDPKEAIACLTHEERLAIEIGWPIAVVDHGSSLPRLR